MHQGAVTVRSQHPVSAGGQTQLFIIDWAAISR